MSDDRKDLPPVSAPNFLEKVRETLSIYMGNRGDKLDRGITLRDLTDSGIVTLRPGFLTGGGRISPIGGIGNAISGAYEPDLTPPPTPTGFMASAAISNIFIEHAAPLYPQGHGHAKTVVYGATWTTGALPVFGDAVKITEFTGTVFAHPTNPATTWHLWIKWVTVDGVESAAPAGGANGLVVTTGQDVAKMVTAMTGPGNPFTILAVDTVIDGVTYPAGTYSSKALIFDAQISNAKIANLAVDNAKIADLSVSTAKINDAAITTAKIGTAQITTAKISTAAITTALISDAAITNAKIGDAQITRVKIGSAAIGSAQIGDLAVDTLQIAGNAVTIPVSAYTEAGIATVSGTVIQSVNITTNGAPVSLAGCATIFATTGPINMGIRIYRDAIRVGLGITQITNSNGCALMSLATIDSPPAGNYTYTLTVSESGTAYNRALTAILVKK